VLRDYPAYREFRERSRAKQPAESSADDMRERGETSSPEDLIDAAVAENRAAVEGEILKKALSLTPTGFENLVIALLEAMGYGRAGSIQRTSATGDAGIDGIISQDPLGLDRIYVQAKRYATDRTVDRPKIHEFAGALLGKQGDRGVFIRGPLSNGADLVPSRWSRGAVGQTVTTVTRFSTRGYPVASSFTK
jgi:restriction system protein